jgi:hypothetical protein
LIGLLIAAGGFLLGFLGRVRLPRVSGVGLWISDHRTLLSATVVAVACFALIHWNQASTAVVGWITLIAAALLIALWLVGRQAPPIPQTGEAAAD